jgi:sugar O-acyltransferase (sialic acid O-acetyltransferase NeuD family)
MISLAYSIATNREYAVGFLRRWRLRRVSELTNISAASSSARAPKAKRMAQPLIILGFSGNAYDVLDIADAINAPHNKWQPVGFLDDSLPPGSMHSGLPVLGGIANAAKFEGHWFINAIGSDRSYRLRPGLIAATGLPAERFATLVHPKAEVSSHAKLGRGVYVNYGVSIAGSAVIGNHVSLGPGCIVGHDTAVGDYAILAPGAVISGFVQLGSNCYIGAAAAIRQRVRIGKGALVGIGAVVIRDVEEGAIVAGNPARAVRTKPKPGDI